MKKLISLILTAILTVSCISTCFALNYSGEQGNEATFETLQEAHANSPEVVKSIMENGAKVWSGHPALEGYPEGTTYVYRSANLYAGRAAARLNTNLFVYTETKFASKDEAFAFLKDAGLIDIVDEAVGSIVLVTPIGETFGRADVASYYALQTAMLAQKDYGKDAEGNNIYYSDAEYFGGYGYEYFIGIDGGATFFNNYIATEIDFVGRFAGALLINGTMEEFRQPAIFVPVWLAGASSEIADKYITVNGAGAMDRTAGKTVYYNQEFPLRKVVLTEAYDLKPIISDAYYGLFVKAMRVPVLPQAVYSGGAPYSGYNFDEAPYSLCDRSIVINGRTADGIVLIKHQYDDTFAAIQTTADVTQRDGSILPAGQYIDMWYEYVPEEVLDGTAPEGTIPLILCNHGSGDDPRVFVEEFGLLELAGQERVALVAPEHQHIAAIRGEALTAVVKYMLETYPALDASRVYATGYSMGGGATQTVGFYDPTLFAAITPTASASHLPLTDEQLEVFKTVDLPAMLANSSYDTTVGVPYGGAPIRETQQTYLRNWAMVNEIELPEYDFEANPYTGLTNEDRYVFDIVNGEFENNTWYYEKDGVPLFASYFVEGMIHALYPEYARINWEFMKHYSRNLETGEIIYQP